MRAAPTRTSFRAVLRRASFCLIMVAPIAGCGTADRMKTASIATEDYRARFPILLTKDTTSIDVFPTASATGLDAHSAKQIIAFAADYRQAGQGPVLVLVPIGPGQREARNMIGEIHRAFAAVGVTPALDVATYPIGNPSLASPVRLSFVGLKARVADQCGQWPSDLASGATVDGWENKQYYNFGCSTQNMIAAQTADPRDLVTPRGEEPADTQIRSRAIENIRKGVDPSTSWTIHNTNIGTVGGS